MRYFFIFSCTFHGWLYNLVNINLASAALLLLFIAPVPDKVNLTYNIGT